MSNTNNPGNIATTVRSDLKMISRFLSRKRSRYIFLVIDDERVLKDFILSVQVELQSKKKEILHLELDREDIYIYKQVKDFLKDKECDGLIVSNLNALIYKDSFQCLSLLNKSRDAFSRFPLPMVFVVNSENLAKVIPGASDFYQLRDLPDFHIEDIKAVEEDISKIATRQYDQIESIDLKVALLEKQVNIAAAKAAMDRDSLNNLVAPLLDLYIEKGNYKKAGELFHNHIEGKERWIRDKMVLGGYYNLIDNEKAIGYFKQALDDYRASGNKVFLLKCLLQLGNSYIDIGAYVEAGACYEEVLEIGRETGDLQGTSSGLHQMGNIAYLKGDYEAALSWYRQSLEVSEKIGDIKGVASSLHQVGMVYQEKGDYEAALIHYQKALEIAGKMRNFKGTAYGLHQIGNIYQSKGDYEAALIQYRKALEIFEKIEDLKGAASSMHQIGLNYQVKGDYEEALTWYRKASEIFEKIGYIQGSAESLKNTGLIYQNKGNIDAALAQYRHALLINKKIGDITGAASMTAEMGTLYFQKQEYETALKLFIQAYLAFSELGSPNAGKAKKDIALVKEKLPETKFKNILKEFNLEEMENQFPGES